MSNMVVNYPRLSHEQVLALEPHYSRHVAAMTEEGLYGKAEIAEQLALRDAKIGILEAEVLYPADRLTQWLKDMGLTLEFQAQPDVPGYTAALFRGVVEQAQHTHLDWQEAIRGVIKKVGLSLPTTVVFNTVLKLKDDVERLEKQIQFLRSGAEVEAYGAVLQHFRDLGTARDQFAAKLKGGGELGPLADVVQEKAEVAFRALRAADKNFKAALSGKGDPTLADFQSDIALVERAMANETPPLASCRSLLEAAQRRVAALEYTLGMKAGETVGLTLVEVTKGLKDLESLFAEAVAKVDAMSPEERETMYRQQRESWARGQVGLIDSDREYSKSRGIDGD